MPQYDLVREASRHCWSNNFLGVFRDFCAKNARLFKDAPAELSGEQNLQYYALFQEYLGLYEDSLSDYIRSLDVSVNEFYQQCADVKNDPKIKDKKLLHFVNYLLACTDYPAFYKVMVRAARKVDWDDVEDEEELDRRAESKNESKLDDYSHKGEGKGVSSPQSKSVHK